MRIRTLVPIALVAVLVITSLPTSHSQTSANAPQKIEIPVSINDDRDDFEQYLIERNKINASRSVKRISFNDETFQDEINYINEEMKKASLLEAKRFSKIGVIVIPIDANYEISATFGQQSWRWYKGWHTGLDFRVPSGTAVLAAANGTIINSGWDGNYGYRIEIDHGNGYVTTYNHLSKIKVSSGDVIAGQEIGKAGSTGNASGPHLHFEVIKDGEFKNPSSWLWKK